MSSISRLALALRRATGGQIALYCGVTLVLAGSCAQWWLTSAPRDYEECFDAAERATTSKETRRSLISECEFKFFGRRKIGGGYTYYDFMQNRSFDIAGPNPNPRELKWMDEQYIVYLDGLRRETMRR